MAAYVKFYDFVEQLGKGVHQLHAAGHVLRAYLCQNAGVTPSQSLDTVKGDLAGITVQNGYDERDIVNDWSETAGVASLVAGADPIVFTGTGAGFGPFQFVVIFNDTPSVSPIDPLICYWDYESEITLVALGETFTIDFGASVFTLE